ncbi:MAG: DUF1015 domain-containing protein [Clostridiales bacterium]|nr:DUF1015 domain-containing protein [Clostridiales bacterium]
MKEDANIKAGPRIFGPADMLIPKSGLEKWSVVACDQHTSEPEYWERVDEYVGDAPSTLRMMLPEHLYRRKDFYQLAEKARGKISEYLDAGVFRTVENSCVYVERTLLGGAVRRGLVGVIDLEQYSPAAESEAPIRATEGIVAEKMPPRIALRSGAKAELTHVMVLVDDPMRTLIEPLGEHKSEMEKLYDFRLMEKGGRIAGWRVSGKLIDMVSSAVDALSQPQVCHERYGSGPSSMLVFAVGDGNHSLATAKACWEAIKPSLSADELAIHPARFALVELINIMDEALEFFPINRVVTECDPEALVRDLIEFFPGTETGSGSDGLKLVCAYADTVEELTLPRCCAELAIGALSKFFDSYFPEHEGVVDYVHGDNVVLKLARKEKTVGFILPALDKSSFFRSIVIDGALPRKTFSMGEAHDKRYYLECRKLEV